MYVVVVVCGPKSVKTGRSPPVVEHSHSFPSRTASVVLFDDDKQDISMENRESERSKPLLEHHTPHI
jgi:hypothetical protein